MNMEKPIWDVIIVGGGPAGLSTALHLQRLTPTRTPRLLILEKARYPRLKLCAGGLVADAEIILQRLGLDVSEVPHVDAAAAHFDFSGKGLKISVPRRHTLRIIRRDEFDAWLARKAEGRGIEIRQGVTVKDLKPGSEGVTVITDQGDFCAQIVVGADGSNGVTRRCILPHEAVHTARVLEVLTPAPYHSNKQLSQIEQTSVGLERGREGVAYFDFFPVPSGIAGYTWDFPTQVNGQAMRCWGIYDTNLMSDLKRPPLKEPLRAEMARHGLNLDEVELKGHPIRWFDPFNTFAVPRVLLVGDAVGADPIFGEGISIALGYGKVAARAIESAFRHRDFNFAGYKRRVLMSPLGQTLLVRWAITYVIYSFRWRWFQILLWRVLKPIVILVAWIFILNWGKRLK